MSDELNNYADYKARRRSVQDTLASIQQNGGKKEYPKDEKLFKFNRDDSGNAFIQLRFLPSRTKLPPLVPRFEHYFENVVSDKKRTFFDNCPTTIGEQCPVCEENKKAWQSGNENLARQRARKQQWFVNIYVIKDANTPEHNGKVFVWKIGKKIYEKIMIAMKPSQEDIDAGKKPLDVFDLENGSDFVVKVKNVGGFVNYDSSYFLDPKPVLKDEKEIEKLFQDIYSLDEYVDPKTFKSYADLQKRIEYVYGITPEDDGVETYKPNAKVSSPTPPRQDGFVPNSAPKSAPKEEEDPDISDNDVQDLFSKDSKKK
jgi:hypothetical protein